jgi:hypothetical protein
MNAQWVGAQEVVDQPPRTLDERERRLALLGESDPAANGRNRKSPEQSLPRDRSWALACLVGHLPLVMCQPLAFREITWDRAGRVVVRMGQATLVGHGDHTERLRHLDNGGTERAVWQYGRLVALSTKDER